MSPELLTGTYGILTDIWSAGVILYTMLCGYPPFYAESNTEIFKKILTGNFSFRGAEWRNVSNSAKDLIRNMLIVNTDLRLNALQTFEHPWLKPQGPSSTLILDTDAVQTYLLSSTMRKAILLGIACHSNDEQIENIKNSFLSLDEQHKGTITLAALQKSLVNATDVNAETLALFVDAMDFNKNGTIEYSEFISAVMTSDVYLNANKLLQVFKIFDTNSNGKISADDLQVLRGRKIDKIGDGLEGVLKEVNCFNAAGISFEEFLQIVASNKVSN